MCDIMNRFSINCHSSIRWGGAVTAWFDPFRVEKTTGDGDVIFITHDHTFPPGRRTPPWWCRSCAG